MNEWILWYQCNTRPQRVLCAAYVVLECTLAVLGGLHTSTSYLHHSCQMSHIFYSCSIVCMLLFILVQLIQGSKTAINCQCDITVCSHHVPAHMVPTNILHLEIGTINNCSTWLIFVLLAEVLIYVVHRQCWALMLHVFRGWTEACLRQVSRNCEAALKPKFLESAFADSTMKIQKSLSSFLSLCAHTKGGLSCSTATEMPLA